MDIHNYKGRYERVLQRIKDSKEITKENKKIILEFKDYLLSEGIIYRLSKDGKKIKSLI